ncbi:hypothetical protein P0D73_10535 [Paraburkholderia sp. RL18-101-BIB-B]|uniref:hypothetical protein n=1 Tax=Paraburkholderia sp. RL18-101-BIB-B TaxID=3031634 RepID=UPI0038B7CCBF
MNHKKRTRETHQGTGKLDYRLALMPAMLMAALGCANTAWAVDAVLWRRVPAPSKRRATRRPFRSPIPGAFVRLQGYGIGASYSGKRVAAQLSYAMRAGHPLAQTARQQTWVTVSTIF